MSVLWSCLWIFATLLAGLGAFALSRRWGLSLFCLFVALFVASNILANKLIVFVTIQNLREFVELFQDC
ncbi:MAG: hypothetical protein R3F19_12145 [Verrucomicrobiales bacterium]